MRWINRTQSSSSESFFPVFNGRYFRFPHISLGFQISRCKLHKNSLRERLLEGKAVTQWDELIEHKAVSQKASFQFLSLDVFFFIIALYVPSNITLKITQNNVSKSLLEGKAVTLWEELSEDKPLSQKASLQFLIEDISFFIVDLYGLPNITLQIPQEQS